MSRESAAALPAGWAETTGFAGALWFGRTEWCVAIAPAVLVIAGMSMVVGVVALVAAPTVLSVLSLT
ncbi:MAG: hypothetical protein ABI461_12140, partial [Polyangiaceae bacterium]